MDAGAGKKILLVDDEPDFLELIRTRLASYGYDVLLAADGREALSRIRSERPDAVLLDLVMDGMDGLETLRQIRKVDPRLPVFMLTAYSDPERFAQANRLSAAGFIVKTADLEKELQAIHSALGIAGHYRK